MRHACVRQFGCCAHDTGWWQKEGNYKKKSRKHDGIHPAGTIMTFL